VNLDPAGLAGLFFAVLGAVWFWHASMAARERANAAAAEACERLRLTLLDGTVALARLWPRRAADGRLRLERSYGFDYTDDGMRRLKGFVVILGGRVESVGLAAARGSPPAPQDPA
jgi:hypothetical protein